MDQSWPLFSKYSPVIQKVHSSTGSTPIRRITEYFGLGPQLTAFSRASADDAAGFAAVQIAVQVAVRVAVRVAEPGIVQRGMARVLVAADRGIGHRDVALVVLGNRRIGSMVSMGWQGLARQHANIAGSEAVASIEASEIETGPVRAGPVLADIDGVGYHGAETRSAFEAVELDAATAVP